MAPPNWATGEQLKFLRSYIPIFIEHTAKETQSKFWLHLYKDWFNDWPELDVLIEDGRLPPQASTADPSAPDNLDEEGPKYQLMKGEHEIYGAAIETRRKVSVSFLGRYHAARQCVFHLEIAKLDEK